MKIDYLMWRDITITHSRGKRVDVIPCGVVDITHGVMDVSGVGIVKIRGYDSIQGVSNTNNYVLGKPQLIRLSATEIELEAYWFGTTFGPKGGQKTRKHKVNIKAKF